MQVYHVLDAQRKNPSILGAIINKDTRYENPHECLFQRSPVALALFLMAAPHLDDHGCIDADPRRFRETVCPAFPITVSEVALAIEQMRLSDIVFRFTEKGVDRLAFGNGPKYWEILDRYGFTDHDIEGMVARRAISDDTPF